MRKSVLKKGLMHVFKLEEEASVIYLEQIASVLTLFLHNKKVKKEVQDILQVMMRNTHHHRNTCQNLLSQLEMDSKNDY